MQTKKILVSFLAVVSVLLLVATVSASEITSNPTVKVDDTYIDFANGNAVNTVAVRAGETISVKVGFTSLVYDQDVTLDVEIDGEKLDSNAMSKYYDVEVGGDYSISVTVLVPYELKDKITDDDATLSIELDGRKHKTTINDIPLKLQRPSYNADIKSITTSQSVAAGQTIPVDVVLKNIGYNDLEDIYVIASIDALGVKQKAYFGDIVAIECDDSDEDELIWSEDTQNRKCREDDQDTVSGRLFLNIPYGAKAGTYTLDVEVVNDDSTSRDSVQLTVQNDFEKIVYRSGSSIWMVNPTDNVVGYRIVPESPASVSESIVFVPAGGSKQVEVRSNVDGQYEFNVNVFTTDGQLVDTIAFSGNTGTAKSAKGNETSPIVILTIILAIVFIVLLVVLIVLIGKKPEKSGEFGESYY